LNGTQQFADRFRNSYLCSLGSLLFKRIIASLYGRPFLAGKRLLQGGFGEISAFLIEFLSSEIIAGTKARNNSPNCVASTTYNAQPKGANDYLTRINDERIDSFEQTGHPRPPCGLVRQNRQPVHQRHLR
jgi:hypothetical protein